jgi:hypothetical protein
MASVANPDPVLYKFSIQKFLKTCVRFSIYIVSTNKSIEYLSIFEAWDIDPEPDLDKQGADFWIVLIFNL